MAKTPTHPVRMDPDFWREFGELTALEGTDRSTVLRELAGGWMKRTRRRRERDAAMRGELRAITRQ